MFCSLDKGGVVPLVSGSHFDELGQLSVDNQENVTVVDSLRTVLQSVPAARSMLEREGSPVG